MKQDFVDSSPSALESWSNAMKLLIYYGVITYRRSKRSTKFKNSSLIKISVLATEAKGVVVYFVE